MIEISGTQNIYLAIGITDMRKSISGLSAIVSQKFKLDPFSDSMFVFCSRNRQRIKILRYETNGWWLYYKVLETGRFQWPRDSGELKQINMQSFRWLLDGLDIDQPRAHKPVKAKFIC